MNDSVIALPERDYVSPGFTEIQLDKHFPNMTVVRDQDVLGRISLLKTRKLRHNHYADQRFPGRGFVNRDEAHILYNTALRYRGRRTLEIGCWLGWSTCHLLAGGVSLDVVDPALDEPVPRESVLASIASSGLGQGCRLFGGRSPDSVAHIAEQDGRRWSLFFIDGNHQLPGPLVDAFICSRYAEANALMLFHDLWQPAVVDALNWLKAEGWHTRVYNTFAIMGAAWRGDMEPIGHAPDRDTGWTIPENLRHHPVAGSTDAGGQ